MIQIEKAEIFGWEGAIEGARFPMNSEDKSDSLFWISTYEDEDYYETIKEVTVGSSDFSEEIRDLREKCINRWLRDDVLIGPADHKLLMNLAKGGTSESKWRRMVHVQMNITAPLYWWKEFETYKVGTVSNSCSTMHKIHSKEFSLEDFSCEHLIREPDYEDYPDFDNDFLADMEEWSKRNEEIDPNYFALHPDECITDVNPFPKSANEREMDWCEEKGAYEIGEDNVNSEYYEDYVVAKYSMDVLNETIKALNYYREKFIETKDKRFWWQMIQLLPSSYNQKRKIDLNYEVLAKQYRERKDHKLDEWRQYCEWIKTLPYSELITLEEAE